MCDIEREYMWIYWSIYPCIMLDCKYFDSKPTITSYGKHTAVYLSQRSQFTTRWKLHGVSLKLYQNVFSVRKKKHLTKYISPVHLSCLVIDLVLPLMNNFNKTEAAVFPCRQCFVWGFAYHQFDISVVLTAEIIDWYIQIC